MQEEPRRTAGLVVARVAGAPVVLTWSWLVLAVVVAVVYGRLLEGPGTSGWLMGLLAALVVTVAVLVHELAHGLTGYVLRMRPLEFVLTFVGGHTSFHPSGRAPWAAAAVTAAGPVSNLLLAGALHLARPLAEGEGPWDETIGVGVVLNIVLAVSNLVPALPLDGGRLWLEIAEGLTGRPFAGLRTLGFLGRLLAITLVVLAVWAYAVIGGWPGLVLVAVAASAGATLWSGGTVALRDARELRRRADDPPRTDPPRTDPPRT